MGIVYFYKKHYNNSLKHYQRILEIDPNNVYAQYNLALVYQKADDPRAIIQWNRYIEIAEGQDDQEIWIAKAKDYLNQLIRKKEFQVA